MTATTAAFTAATAPTLTVDGAQASFAYRRFGAASGQPPLVLCMRLRGSLDHWDPVFLDALAAEREVVIFDNVGTGRTTGPVPESLEDLADGAADFIAALGLTEVDLIGWSLERDGPLHKGGGFYHKSIRSAVDRDGDTLTVLDVLAKQVGVRGMFSDWPATTTFYASCTGMK